MSKPDKQSILVDTVKFPGKCVIWCSCGYGFSIATELWKSDESLRCRKCKRKLIYKELVGD